MKRRPSLAYHALLAVLLTVGFYVLALAAVAGLVWVVIAGVKWRYVPPQFTFGCIVLAAAIVWGILPRRRDSTPPGPEIDRDDHPQLFQIIEGVAAEVGHPMPGRVYAVPDVDAAVDVVGGFLGFGGRRILIVGVPLLQCLTIRELRAILAHEFGHFLGGDMKLGPWIYGTRLAIERTTANVSRRNAVAKWLFIGYGHLFLRITRALSRAQELAADELSLRVAGADASVNALRKQRIARHKFEYYWESEFEPIARSHYVPPILEGFVEYQRSPTAEAIERFAIEEIETAGEDPYDTHPPMRVRIAELEGRAAGRETARERARDDSASEDAPALSAVSDPEALQRAAAKLSRKEPIAWSEVAEKVYIPGFRDGVGKLHATLVGLTPRSIAGKVGSAAVLSRRLVWNSKTANPEQRERGRVILGYCVALALVERGWALDARPGYPISCRLAEEEISPFVDLTLLALKQLDPDTWVRRCEAAGIADVDLGSTAGPAPVATSTAPTRAPRRKG